MRFRSSWLRKPPRFSSRITLVVIALALGGYVFVSEQPPGRDRGAGGSGDYSAFDPATVRAVELLRSNIVIRVERAPNGWRMTVPVQYGAQGTAVEAFLASLAGMRPRMMIPSAELTDSGGTDDLKAFGLDGGAITVTLETADGTPVLFQLGGPTPLGAQF